MSKFKIEDTVRRADTLGPTKYKIVQVMHNPERVKLDDGSIIYDHQVYKIDDDEQR